ncbi:MAG: aspartate aminotransferase family protein [Actinomycetota bacterium]|jgi:glutamate-1-semialdehyde 2,1-aminomutase|nr:aspartate aminotransferase family protein [Actinomycetota bacterium]MDA3015765.1 aspartate aminotransferase family protein [Actinomycetota bacterium]MDA3029583.1 aspartate aminotransferase family protein [Actinomycetota bacterium]
MSTTEHAGLVAKAKEITEREIARYAERTIGSQRATERTRRVMPAGVPSSFQAYDPHPIVVSHASGSRMTDVDGNVYVDYDMGFGALFAGHMNPAVRRAVSEQLDDGTLYVTPCELNGEVGEILAERYGFPLWRPTNSGTEATMDAIRLARGVTGRDRIVKVEGGYHGHHDEVMISNKPPLDLAGPADRPNSVPQSKGIPHGVIDDVIVIPFNDPEALDRALSGGDVACFIVEPVMENIGICLPDPGYLEAVREITERHGTLLIFDEVKTGITAGYGGATNQLGVRPDLITLAKSIGGGFPVGAFGGKAEYMDLITDGTVLHLGTYNGNPLVMAAVKATLTEACTRETVAATVDRNTALVSECQRIIDRSGIPAHTVQFGAKGCITWSTTPVRNYRDYKATDFDLAFAQWIHGINRGVLLPPGLDEQWLISVMHDDSDSMRYAEVFAEFVDEVIS